MNNAKSILVIVAERIKMSKVTIGGGYKANAYLIFALTPIHAGSGSRTQGFVDLPIQRDSYDFPVIWGSSLKGAMRGTYFLRGNKKENEDVIFGPRPREGRRVEEDYASSIVVTDANLFLMPIRSLHGIYAYATNEFLLNKAKAYFSLINKEISESISNVVSLLQDKSIVSSEEIVKDCKVTLMEQDIEVEVKNKIKEEFGKILPNNLPIPKDEILKRIVVLSNKYSSLIKRATIINTRIAIEHKKKIVKEGALWTEEYLPELTLMYNLVLFTKPRKENAEIKNEEDVINNLTQGLGGNVNEFTLILGGDETIGKGIVKFCKVG